MFIKNGLSDLLRPIRFPFYVLFFSKFLITKTSGNIPQQGGRTVHFPGDRGGPLPS